MGTGKTLKGMFSETIQITKLTCSSIDGYPSPGYATSSISYSGKVERYTELIRDENGKTIKGSFKVFLFLSSTGLASTTIPRIGDKLELPSNYNPALPTIQQIHQQHDERGRLHHLVLYC